MWNSSGLFTRLDFALGNQTKFIRTSKFAPSPLWPGSHLMRGRASAFQAHFTFKWTLASNQGLSQRRFTIRSWRILVH